MAILETAFEEGIDVICVQEPSTFPPTRTQNHPSYHRYDPVDSWDSEEQEEREAERPRVLTYVQKSPDLKVRTRRSYKS